MRGSASCEADIATGSIGERQKRRRRAAPNPGLLHVGESGYIAARCPAPINPIP